MDSHHSLQRRLPRGFDIAFATLVFAMKMATVSPISTYLKGTAASATARPVSIHITVSVCCETENRVVQNQM